jgi:hypothetical protein
MHGAIPPLTQYAFMAWCSVKAQGQQHGELRNAYKILVRKPEENKPLGKSRYRWEDNIRMDLRKIE